MSVLYGQAQSEFCLMIMFLSGVANQSRDRIFFDSQQSLTRGMKLFL
ncbi:Hypothetical protein P9303_02341 [Prochlorococcus marinus str. MIT 9303]|uniref:Uncharacterized protein n=1 Tax=Prochlorococcus marinus (strain MIT 9303) TaxID=59922 RepID=A2C679_PROM3|nr:Hypothetical protein P9303_02341 [Prochlorococcus marinus str. MIT 9303]